LVIDALTLHLIVFIFFVMSTSMNMCFHLIILNRLQRSRTQPPPNSPLSPSQICSTTHHYPLPPASQTATSPQLCRSKQPPDHNLRPSLSHHPILVYLTLMMQVQLVNWSHLLIFLGPSLVPPLLRPPWPVFLQIRFLLTASSLFRPP
jgi:hypothetical protein